MNKAAFQEQIKGNYCWGCGSLNEHGLKIRSYWSGDEAVCTWQPKEYQCAGPKDILNGGIIATLIDCHSICTAIAAAYRKESRKIGTEPCIRYATRSLQVEYLKPTPMGEPITILAKIKEVVGRKTVVCCSLFARGEECARGEVVAVRVAADWERTSHQGATRM